MSKHHALTATLLLALAAGPAMAADAPPPPEPTAPRTDDEAMPEPEITIRKSEGQDIEEYRIKGRLYMIKITPQAGPAYYLIDTDGDGELETRHNGPMDAYLIPQWILFRW
ncbi:MAG: DUF2782 domain-containing protein [Halothiobacillaceae bacterium]|nr:MAG: DUF2782 domain-containing protein [Halothiobacillaceae bacterium]